MYTLAMLPTRGYFACSIVALVSAFSSNSALAQQKTLAPLKADWESLEPERRRKWVGIANRYPKMKAEEQDRVQRRMQAWAKLSPEQRRQARENYRRIVKTPPETRERLSEAWAEYQALPPDQRQSLVPPSPPPAEKKRR